MFNNINICKFKSGSGNTLSEHCSLSTFLIQKKKNTLYLIAAIIFTLPGLTLKTFPSNILKTETDLQEQTDFNLVIQVGAFTKETNATVFREKLAALIDKPVIMVVEEGYFKVQLTGFKNIDEIEKIIPALGLIGIRDFWVRPAIKETEVSDYTELMPDTTQMNFEEKTVKTAEPAESDSLITEVNPAETTDIYAIEVGVFRQKNRALNAQSKIISKLNLPVELVTQWNLYHVIITGFNNKTEINKYIPEIAKLGYDDISVIKNYGKQQ